MFTTSLKDTIQTHVSMHHLATWMEACTKAIKVERALAAQLPRPNFIAKGCPTQAHGATQTLKFQ